MQRKLFFLAYFFICAVTSAQQYPFIYYTPKDGLVNSRVRSIQQDSRGRLYFLTFGGLSVYDGTRFMNYHKENGLANELVNDLMEVTPDSFLVATNTNVLNTLVKGKVGNFKTANNFSPIVNRFLKSREGDVYVAADDGLFLLKPEGFKKLPLLDKQKKDAGFYLDKLMEWEHFILILPWDQGGLMLFDKRSRQLKDIFLKEKIFNLTLDQQERIWISTFKGLRLLDQDALKKEKIVLKDIPDAYKQIAGNITGTAYFDKKGNCFLANGTTIHKISPELQMQTIDASNGLKIPSLNELFIDREGLIWLATDGNGAVKWKGTETKMINSFEGRPSLITALASQGDTVWFFNVTDQKIRYFFKGGSGSYPVNIKNCRPYNIYVQGKTLYMVEPGRFITIHDKHNPASYLHASVASHETKSSNGNGIVDPNGAIILHKTRAHDSFFLSVIKNGNIVFEQPIQYTSDQMVIDRQGRLWVITRSDNLLQFSIHPGNEKTYLKLEKDYGAQLKNKSLRSIVIDTSGYVWLGTRSNGLFRLSFDGNRLDSMIQFTTANGLSDNFIYSLACDRNNVLWIGTQNGLDRIFEKNGKYIIGNTGRVNNWFQTIMRLATTSSGNIWALTSEGSILNVSAPASPLSPYQPELNFTAVSVNSQLTELRREFSHKQNNFSFSVAAPSFIDEASIRYSYLLEGSGNKEWSKAGNLSEFHFINLSPGSYTLKIRAEFPEETYPPKMINYSFLINPPWWQTWWFRIGFGLLLLASSVMFVRYYYKRKMHRQRSHLERQQAIEKERTRIATDMHDDLGAGLSRIKFLSETIGLKKQQHQPIEEEISKIREYSHHMIDKMGEIVWALNEKNDSLSDLLSYTRAYAMEYLSQNGIHCEVDMPDQFQGRFVSGEFRRNVFLSVKEALHNVVKHAEAETVNISINTGRELQVKIKDDGRGFTRCDMRPFSNGLGNIEKRMKDIGGRYSINHDQGVTIILEAPLS